MTLCITHKLFHYRLNLITYTIKKYLGVRNRFPQNLINDSQSYDNIYCAFNEMWRILHIIPVKKTGELDQEDGDMAVQIVDRGIEENVNIDQSLIVHLHDQS